MWNGLSGLLGAGVLLILAWSLSETRSRVPWRTVAWGMGFQLSLGMLFLNTSLGTLFFEGARKGVGVLEEVTRQSATFVFGAIGSPEKMGEAFGAGQGFILAIPIVTTIVFVSSLSALFYHWGVLPRVVQGVAWVMRRFMRVSGPESLAVAANIFLGQNEAPLLVKPYLGWMTRSELFAVMVGGMATIAGSVLVAYVSFGADPGHLMTASLMSAPATLVVAKLMIPETLAAKHQGAVRLKMDNPPVNAMDAICRGASEGLQLALTVCAMLLALVALVALANWGLAWVWHPSGGEPLTFQRIMGWVNAPFAWLIGVPWNECSQVGQVMGERIVLNEFVAYLSLSQMKESLDPRTFALATYALCGFANFGSIAIQIGGIGFLAPGRQKDLASLGLKAMVGGLLACYLTATIAGIFL